MKPGKQKADEMVNESGVKTVNTSDRQWGNIEKHGGKSTGNQNEGGGVSENNMLSTQEVKCEALEGTSKEEM